MIGLTVSNILGAIAGVTIIGLLIWIAVLRGQLATEVAAHGLTKEDLVAADMTISAFATAAERQRFENEKALNRAAVENAEYRRALSAANARADAYQKQANDILKLTPKPGEDLAEAARRVLVENAK